MVCLHMFLQDGCGEECCGAMRAAEGRAEKRGEAAVVEKVVVQGDLKFSNWTMH